MALPFAGAEASGMPLPEPPSKVLPWSMIGVGTAAAVFGGLAGLDAVSRDRALQTELDNGPKPGTDASLRALDGALFLFSGNGQVARFAIPGCEG